jgi:hypothetical protein
MLLSGYGNAICIPLAAAFVLAAGKEEKES